ncbi:hybrid sensor histidine kinase/response regulator transcription factor [Winogradskyella schleiferi]|uniref:hybrid sensor histidine kinase/response regulator transcription factor n=1 Tax=Winogradskyella schleiferi TaxID=2686078 RepID=UPI0015B83410|nr:hybrid sensor histidine kinase/response regulator transcription factor [Winogradskyella schleiferi]
MVINYVFIVAAQNFKIFRLFIITLFFSSTFAQSYPDFHSIKYFTLEDGLSQVSTNDLLLDHSGFVWIATQDGLNRFDGNQFKQFKHHDSDSATISGNLTNNLLEDKKGNIWVGTIGSGLSYYNQNQERFYKVNLKFSKDENEVISDLTLDKEGTIWVASRLSGLHKIKGLEDNTFLQKNYLPNQSLSALLASEDGNLWVGDFEGNVYKIDTSKNYKTNINPELKVNSRVRTFYNTGEHLLIGGDFGLYIYDFKNKKLDLFEFEITSHVSVKFITSFLKKNDSSVWVGTGNGLFLLDFNKMKIIQEIEKSIENESGLSNSTVTALLKMDKDKILVGTANNLNLVNFKPSFFKNISKNKRGNHVLNDNVIFSILKDQEDLWVGTSDGGLNLIRNGKPYYFENVKNDSIRTFGTVREIVKDDKNQRLWFATTRGLRMLNLKTFDPNQPKFKVFRYNPNDFNSINGDFLKGLALDQNNNIWGATYGYGVFRLEMKENGEINVIRYVNNPENKNSLQNNVTMCVRIDKKNNAWIGTQGGLTKIHFKNEGYINPVFTNYNKDRHNKASLSHNAVYDILIDKNDSIWVGTRNGLNLFLGHNTFASWKEQNQFTNAAVYSIQDDHEDNLWLGTNDGLVNFNTKNRKFTQYNIEDGIQSKEFDIHARFKDEDGIIYMGGIGGVTYFQPNDLNNLDHPKPLYFSQLKVKDEIIKPNNSNNLLVNSLPKTKLLEFKQNQFPFYLQFSAIDFRIQKHIKYGYKLLPNDKDWNMLEDTNIQFLNLPSGDYKLQVNGFSRGKIWNQAPLEIDLKVLPPLWATWWAYVMYTLILGCLTYVFYNFLLSKKLAVAERNKLKDLNTLKSNLYTNITHEFRTPLTVILGLADTIKDDLRTQNYKTANEAMTIIERNGKDLLLLVNQLLGISKAESGTMDLNLIQGDIVPFLRYICESFQSLAKTKNIDITAYFETESLNMDFDDGKLQIIISNLLSNAIKFSAGGKKIILHVKCESINETEYAMIKVKDYGIGISEKVIPHIFDRFYQVENSFSKAGKGTGIGLALTKELVALMNGTIAVKSIEGKGTEFTVAIPITRNSPIATQPETRPIDFVDNVSTEPEWSMQIFDKDVNLPKALIIEDNKDVAYYLKLCLQNKYHCFFANNGNLGLEKAFEKIPDIIICDVMMPERDGFEVCKLLKTDERTDHIPVILLTAKTSETDRLKGLQHGADAYLTKPFLKAELLTRLDQLIILRKRITQSFAKNKFSQILVSRDHTPETKFLQKVIQIIQSNIDDPNLGSRHVAQKMNLSESQTYRKLKAITGKSTAVFIRSVRLEKAKDLIQTTDKSISEIAYEVGFNDPSWFSRAFKEEFGQTPSAIHK